MILIFFDILDMTFDSVRYSWRDNFILWYNILELIFSLLAWYARHDILVMTYLTWQSWRCILDNVDNFLGLHILTERSMICFTWHSLLARCSWLEMLNVIFLTCLEMMFWTRVSVWYSWHDIPNMIFSIQNSRHQRAIKYYCRDMLGLTFLTWHSRRVPTSCPWRKSRHDILDTKLTRTFSISCSRHDSPQNTIAMIISPWQAWHSILHALLF